MIEDVLARLKQPDNAYRGIPFWSWNAKLDEDELRRQVRDMAQAGFGGYFIHARAGLKTPYFGEEWMQCIQACLEEGERAGIRTWLYDENGYPSGFAGGAVPALGSDYMQKHLHFQRTTADQVFWGETSLALYSLGEDCRRVEVGELTGSQEVLHAYYILNPYYADLLDEKVVKAFIDSTYEAYYRRFGKEFGGNIPGVFTDEPQYGRLALPWSFVLPGAFEGKWGYDILDALPALYGEVPGFRRSRHHFWKTVTDLFINHYAKQLSQWCEDHGCLLTGHVLLEEDTRWQTMCNGSAMAFYRYMQVPGIDWLGRDTGSPVIVKQLSSVAAQMGREQVLSEMFAAAGWNTTLADFKHIAQWQYALGVNLICPHLYPYTLEGVRKNDHPPTIAYQANWWEQSRTFNDYFARLGMLLSQGEEGEQLLVLNPLRSGWVALDHGCYDGGPNEELAHIDDSFDRLSRLLTGLHVQYHYADEDMLAELGAVEGDTLCIGKCRYGAVLLPVCTNLEPETVDRLLAFVKAGGKLYALEEFPALVRGEACPALDTLRQAAHILPLEDAGSLLAALPAACKPVRVLQEGGGEALDIYCRISRYAGGAALYLVNMDTENGRQVEVTMPGYPGASLLMLEDCTARRLPLRGTGGIGLHFDPGQSHVLWFDDNPGEAAPPPARIKTIPLGEDWAMRALTPNVLPLDYARLSVEGGPWSEPLSLVAIMERLVGLGKGVDIALAYEVQARPGLEDRDMWLVVDDADPWELTVNGRPLSPRQGDWWKDRSFRRIDIRGMLGEGKNTLLLRKHFKNSPRQIQQLERGKKFEAEMNMFTYDSEVHNLLLLGDFLVESMGIDSDQPGCHWMQPPLAIAPSGERKGDDATKAGCPFFTGTLRMEQQVDIPDPGAYGRVLFRMEKPFCAYSRLLVNGQPAATLLWAPYEADIGSLLRPGANTLTLELQSTDRNLFGPHHHPEGELHSLGPVQFTDREGWREDYCVVPFGLAPGAQLICMD